MAWSSAIGAGAAEEIAARDADAQGVVTVEDGGELDLAEDKHCHRAHVTVHKSNHSLSIESLTNAS